MVVNRKTVRALAILNCFCCWSYGLLETKSFSSTVQWSADEEVGQRMRTLSGQQHETQNSVYGFRSFERSFWWVTVIHSLLEHKLTKGATLD